MNLEDLQGYMLDEVAKAVKSIEVTTEEELHENLCSEGGQTYEELGYDLMVMYLRSKNSEANNKE